MPLPIGIPQPDLLSLPSPPWLLKFFLLFGFLLHIVAMNFMLGGTVLAIVSYLKRQSEHHRELANSLFKLIPTPIAAAVPLGLAPLLFAQTLYGHLFYSSSIIIGWWWWLIIPALIIAYYMAYNVTGRTGLALSWRPWLIALLLLGISFVFSNNLSLMQTPQRFVEMQQQTQSGWLLNLSEPTLFPRWLHMVLGALAVAALLVALIGDYRRRTSPAFGDFAVNYGGKVFGALTHLQVVVGIVFLITLRREVMLQFMGQDMLATILLPVSILLAVYLGVLGFGLAKKPGRVRLAVLLTGLMLVIMVVMRDIVRDAYLTGLFDYRSLESTVAWSPFIVFVVVFILGLATLAWMLVRTFARSKS
jgi:hypothetical protein